MKLKDRKSRTVCCRLNVTEQEAVIEAAKRSGKTMSTWMGQVLVRAAMDLICGGVDASQS